MVNLSFFRMVVLSSFCFKNDFLISTVCLLIYWIISFKKSVLVFWFVLKQNVKLRLIGFYLFIGITFPFLWLYINIKNSTFQYHFCTKLTTIFLCKREKLLLKGLKSLTFKIGFDMMNMLGRLCPPFFIIRNERRRKHWQSKKNGQQKQKPLSRSN